MKVHNIRIVDRRPKNRTDKSTTFQERVTHFKQQVQLWMVNHSSMSTHLKVIGTIFLILIGALTYFLFIFSLINYTKIMLSIVGIIFAMWIYYILYQNYKQDDD